MYDIFSNHKIVNVRSYAQQTPGAANQPADAGVDLWELSENGLYERNNRALLMVEVGAVAGGATLDIIVQDYGPDDETWDADFCTLTQITATGQFRADIKNFRQKLRLNATVGVGNISWGAQIVCFDATRRPVKQNWTALTSTYATGR